MKSAVRALAVVLVLAPVLTLGAAFLPLTAAPGPHTAGAVAATEEPALPGLIIGDSMSARSREQLRAGFPEWEINAVRGRHVSRLIPVLRAYKETGDGLPPVVVLALGSNEEGWFPRLYRYAADMLPAETTLVFQSVWRDERVFPGRAAVMRRLTRSMRQVARHRPHTCLARWRPLAVRDHETLVLRDGVHPNAAGKEAWTSTVARAVRRCS